MKTFHELYLEITEQERKAGRNLETEYHPYHMDCLLEPESAPVPCKKDKLQKLLQQGKEELAPYPDVQKLLNEMMEEERETYILVAPAFLGQFPEAVTAGELRAAFKALGFQGMIEVAVFADILTLKEALEFDKNITSQEDYQLTSCCCPVWIALIRNVYKELMPHVPATVSPMIAGGRVVKKLHPTARTVFVGPCMAKKKEAKEPDIADAIDCVLTFQEVKALFDAADVQPEKFEEKDREHSSRAGRIYAHTGGVSEAVKETVKQLNPNRWIEVRAEQADGVPGCRELIEKLKNGETRANFFEGMACPGGCVGGPRAILPKEEGKEHVVRYGEEASYRTPLENPYVLELLSRLGFEKVEDLLHRDTLFVREF